MYSISQIKSILSASMICDFLGLQESKNEIKSSEKNIFILCPDHQDRNPNSCVLTNYGYTCFACGSHGSLIDLYAKRKNISFSEAVNKLGDCLHLKESNEAFEPSPLSEEDKEALGLNSIQYLKRLWLVNKDAYYYSLNKIMNERKCALKKLYYSTNRSSPDFKDLGIYNSDVLFKIRSQIENYLMHIEKIKNG